MIKRIFFLLALFPLWFCGLTGCSQQKDVTDKGSTTINCLIQEGACAIATSFGILSLDIHPKPVRAMSGLTFTVEFNDRLPKEIPYIDLNMTAMDMGYNRVYLHQVRPGVFQGTGVIVRCPSGIPVWQAEVNAPGLGKAAFIFEVTY